MSCIFPFSQGHCGAGAVARSGGAAAGRDWRVGSRCCEHVWAAGDFERCAQAPHLVDAGCLASAVRQWCLRRAASHTDLPGAEAVA